MMVIKRTRITLLIVTAVIAVTLVSYSIALNIMLKNSLVVKNEQIERSSNITKSKVFNGNVEVKLNIVPSNTINTISTYNNDELGKLVNEELTLRNIETYFYGKGYILQSSNEENIVFVKSTKYIPEKYYLGVNDGYISILKCNDEGDLIIENNTDDVSRKTLEQMPLSDRDFIKNNEYIFDSKDEALDELASITS